jgi:hypothetical protein
MLGLVVYIELFLFGHLVREVPARSLLEDLVTLPPPHARPHQPEHPGRESSCAAQRSSTGHWLAHWAVAMS